MNNKTNTTTPDETPEPKKSLTDKVKNHMTNHKESYIALAVGIIIGSLNRIQIVNTVAPVFNNDNSSNAASFGGHSHKIVRCNETGQLWETVTEAAIAAGVSQPTMSKQVNGKSAHIDHKTYSIVGLGSGN